MRKNMSNIQACCVCLVWRSNLMRCRLNRTGKPEPWKHGTSLGATNGYDKTCCVTIFAVAQENGTLCELSKESPCSLRESHHLHVHHRPTRGFCPRFQRTKMITNDTDTQRKQWKSSCQTSTNLLNQHLLSALPGDKIDGMSAGRCQKQRKYWTIRRLA